MGWTAGAAHRRAATSGTAGSRCRRSSSHGRGARWPPTRRRRSPSFVAELDRRAAEQHAPVADGVTLATLHAAKGLEWDAVFLCRRCTRARCRSSTPTTPAAVEEERRLLYVGMTRARDHLAVSWAAGPHPGRPGLPQAVPLPRPGCGRRAPRTGPPPARPVRRASRGLAHCRECGRPLATDRASASSAAASDCPATYDEAAVRARCASGAASGPAEERVPAYVVFTDATLQAIAEVRPADARRACCRITASAPAKVDQVRREVLGDLGEVEDGPVTGELCRSASKVFVGTTQRSRLPLTGHGDVFFSPHHEPPGASAEDQEVDCSERHHQRHRARRLRHARDLARPRGSLRAFPIAASCRLHRTSAPSTTRPMCGATAPSTPTSPSSREPSRVPPPGVRRSR